jgi:hypothetical protein
LPGWPGIALLGYAALAGIDRQVGKLLLKALHDFDRVVRRATVDDDDLVSSVVVLVDE